MKIKKGEVRHFESGTFCYFYGYDTWIKQLKQKMIISSITIEIEKEKGFTSSEGNQRRGIITFH